MSSGPLDRIADTFGIPDSTYSDKTQSASCSPRIHRHDPREMPARESRSSGEMQSADIFVRQTEILRPVKDGRFTIDGEVWNVDLNPTLLNGTWKMVCTRVNPQRRGEVRVANA